MDVDYANDIVLLANTPAQAETLLHSLEWTAAAIGLHVNADKTEYMCFNQRSNISTLNGSSLKLVEKFTYLGSSVSSTKTDINKRLARAWTSIDWLSTIRKSDLTDKIKHSFVGGHVIWWVVIFGPPICSFMLVYICLVVVFVYIWKKAKEVNEVMIWKMWNGTDKRNIQNKVA